MIAETIIAGLTADCTGIEISPEDGALLQTRPAFGGNIMATIACPGHRPQMAIVRPFFADRGTGVKEKVYIVNNVSPKNPNEYAKK